MDKIVFKKITPEEVKNFFKFFEYSIHSQFPEYSVKTRKKFTRTDYALEKLEKGLANKELAVYAAFNGNDCVGYLMASAWCGGICFINWMAVAKKFQGKGIASKLLQMCEKEAKLKGFHKFHLWTDGRNLKFYKSKGFKLIGKIPESDYGADNYLFYKTIQKPSERNFLKSTKI
ncbi:MAG: N-acetyltransferase [Spirochaetia bacterium]|nr:MAG: N-acetyltransferase [Spirochaetia bacterium]